MSKIGFVFWAVGKGRVGVGVSEKNEKCKKIFWVDSNAEFYLYTYIYIDIYISIYYTIYYFFLLILCLFSNFKYVEGFVLKPVT